MNSEIFKKIVKSRDVLLLGHKDPDGDALGSVSALADFLLKEKKNCQIFIPGELPRNFNFLTHYNLIKDTFSGSCDLIIACDYSDFKRTGFNNDISDDIIITFDHHIKNENQRGALKIIDPKYSSTCELLYYFFKEEKIEISQNIAVSLLTGILTDTGFFKNPNVSPDTFKAVKKLIIRGASVQQIFNAVYSSDGGAIRLWSEALELTQFDLKGNIVYTCIPYEIFKKYDQAVKEISGFSSFINAVSGAKVALTLTEQEPNIIRGSLRAKANSGINVAKIAENMGGGGHKLAAGFETKGNFDKIITKVKELF